MTGKPYKVAVGYSKTTGRARWKHFQEFSAAVKYADQIRLKTGVFVAIEYTSAKAQEKQA